MGAHVPGIVSGSITSPVVTIPSGVDTAYPNRLTPRLRSGYFYSKDRRYFLYSQKATGLLEDITWYKFRMANKPIVGTERVWVKGIEVTGSGQYKFEGPYILVNGSAISHPGTLVEEINYDHSLLDPIDSGAVFDPDTQVELDYEYNDFSIGAFATASSITDAGVTYAGFSLRATREGAWAHAAFGNLQITINTAGGSEAITEVALFDWEIDYISASTTVQDVIDLINSTGDIYAEWDAVGDPDTDLFADLLSGASITPPYSDTFTGGSLPSYTATNINEIFYLRDTEIFHQFPYIPNFEAPIVMTDDSIQHHDQRDIAPEFSVSDEGIVEFNAPRNYIANPEFLGSDINPDLWITSGTVDIVKDNPTFAGDYTGPWSSSNFASLTSGAELKQITSVFDQAEMVFSAVWRDDGAGGGIDVTFTFYDDVWTSLGSYTDTFDTTSHPTCQSEWVRADVTFGPSGQRRIYDHATFADATWVDIEITSNNDVDVDFVFWGLGKLPPDLWTPHSKTTIEFEVGDTYYEHQPLISYDYLGEARANQSPLETCNTQTATNSNTTGFLHFHEYSDTSDFGLGIGGINSPLTGAGDEPLEAFAHVFNTDDVIAVTSDGSGGWFLGGRSYTTVDGVSINRLARFDKYGRLLSFSHTFNGAIRSLERIGNILYLAGSFTTVDSITRNRFAAIDITTDTLTSLDPNISNTVYRIKAGPDGKELFIAGDYVTIDGQSRNRLSSIVTDTTRADYGSVTSFDPNVTGGEIFDITFDKYGRLYLCGDFSSVSGSGRTRIAAFESDLTTLTALGDASGGGPSADANAIVVDRLGDIHVGGNFFNASGSSRTRYAVYDLAGTLDSRTSSADDQINHMIIVGDYIYLAGAFNAIQGITRNYLAKIDIDMTLQDWNPDPDASASFLFADDRVIIAGGNFTDFAGSTITGHQGAAWFKNYNGSVVVGRRHLPYSKMDGLGKLRQMTVKRFYAQPPVYEVTTDDPAPKVGRIDSLLDYGFVTDNFATPSLGSSLATGDTTITVTSGADSLLEDLSLVTLAGTNTQVVQVKKIISDTEFLIHGSILYTFPSISTSVTLSRPALKAYEGQQRYIRGRVLDEYGSPIGQREVSVVLDTSLMTVEEDPLPTNQDGEFSVLVNFNTAGDGPIDLVLDGVVERIYVKILTLP